jgi:outer membrane protein OmpA-like peptidoglycan-associated protein
MKKILLYFCVWCLYFSQQGQITIIGHNMLNNSAVFNTRIITKVGGVVTKTLSTGPRADFKLELPFGNVYHVYFQNALGPVMFMEVAGNNVPDDKLRYLMTYEMNIPFVNKKDEDVDTTVFVKPFHRIVFNGQNRMVADTAYNSAFENSIIKKQIAGNRSPTNKNSMVLSGKIVGPANSPAISGQQVSLLNKNHEVIKTTYANRFGAFAFTGVQQDDASAINLDLPAPVASDTYSILNTKNDVICVGKVKSKGCEWDVNSKNIELFLDNNFTTNIGGKLVSSSPREKKFFSEKTVYLSNKMNTIIQKTKTNLFGTFAFEDIKPDNVYYIGVDREEIPHGAKIDLLNKEDRYIATLDTLTAGRTSLKLVTTYNRVFNEISIGENEMKMDVKATIFGDNVNNPIGKLKILLLNDNYEVIDSAITDNFGTFKFKYLPFLKRFYLSAENTDNVLDVFKNILIYSSDDNLIKIMTHQKGSKFTYNPVSAELSRLRDIELEDPWLELVTPASSETVTASGPSLNDKKSKAKNPPKLIVENILFEANQSFISPQAKEILDKVILVLQTNKNLKIEVGAHTDSKGSAAANLKLSESRARTVQQYIISKNIEKTRIFARGYGETVLLNHCDDNHNCSETEHAQNRRIEFKILGEETNQ